MARQQCACGVVFRFPDSSIGKRGKCKHCGEVFLLTGEYTIDTIPIADESTSFGTEFVEDTRGATDNALSPIPDGAAVYAKAGDDFEGAQSTSYGQDLLWPLLFPLSPGNWGSFGVMFVALLMIPFFPRVPVLGWILALLIFGYYAASRFPVVD